MKKISVFVLGILTLLIISCSSKVEDVYTVELDSLNSKGCYALGRTQGESARESGIQMVWSYYAKGVFDTTTTDSLWFSSDEMNQIFTQYISEYYRSGKSIDEGKELTSVDSIKALKKTDDLPKSFSYVYGVISSPLMNLDSDFVDTGAYVAGFLSSVYGKESILTEKELADAYQDWYGRINALLEDEKKVAMEENLKKAEEFLEKNKSEDGVIVLNDGLQIKKLISNKSGRMPELTDTVVVDYTLTLLDGSVVDNGSDVTFSLSTLIPGFSTAVTNMREGERVLAYIHPDQGYGEADLGVIEPNSLLIFDITLKSIN